MLRASAGGATITVAAPSRRNLHLGIAHGAGRMSIHPAVFQRFAKADRNRF